MAVVDPLGADNPLIFSAGPFAGSNFSNANRISVGCKSPLTGGIKEANSGGTFATAMGQAQIATMVLRGQSPDWLVLHVSEAGVRFDDATPYLGQGVFATGAALLAAYGPTASLALIGPVAEYGGLMAGISFTDVEGRPLRLAARGGVGAVMAAKKVKAIVIDKDKMPPVGDMAKVMEGVRAGSAAGRLYAQGTARVGAHFQLARVPVIKGQAISAYDPRVVEVTGISMMLTAQGADHTVGNMPSYKSADQPIEVLVRKSLEKQASVALADSIGLCIFGGEVTVQNLDLVAETMNAAFGCDIDADFLRAIGRDTLALEDRFNADAGFGEADDALPAFFHDEALPPTMRKARLDPVEINRLKHEILQG